MASEKVSRSSKQADFVDRISKPCFSGCVAVVQRFELGSERAKLLHFADSYLMIRLKRYVRSVELAARRL